MGARLLIAAVTGSNVYIFLPSVGKLAKHWHDYGGLSFVFYVVCTKDNSPSTGFRPTVFQTVLYLTVFSSIFILFRINVH